MQKTEINLPVYNVIFSITCKGLMPRYFQLIGQNIIIMKMFYHRYEYHTKYHIITLPSTIVYYPPPLTNKIEPI
jgi:hypothetical protein